MLFSRPPSSQLSSFIFIFHSAVASFQLFYDPSTRIIISFDAYFSLSFQIDYLKNYGYLPSKSIAERFGDDIVHEDTIASALKALQVRITSHVFVFMKSLMRGNVFCRNSATLTKQACLMMQRKHCCGSQDVEILILKSKVMLWGGRDKSVTFSVRQSGQSWISRGGESQNKAFNKRSLLSKPYAM